MNTYRPPFVSERLGEARFIDCTVAAGMMGSLGSWSYGELLRKGNRPMNAGELRQLRHELSRADAGGSDPLDFNLSVQKKWPDLPEIPSWDNPRARLRIKFPEWKRRIQNGECGLLQGNPIRVRDPKSPLKRFVGDAGHAIEVDSGGPGAAKVYDPMGLPIDTYNGSFVKWKDLEEFGSEFSGAGFMFVSLVQKGGQNSVTLNKQIAQLTAELADKNKKLTVAQNRVVDLNIILDQTQRSLASISAERDTAVQLKTVAETALAACMANGGSDCSAIQAQLDLTIAEVTARNQRIRNLESERDGIMGERDQALLDLKACQDGNPPPPTDATAFLAWLRTEISQ